MDFAPFDKRGYPVASVQSGYGEWANHYEATVAAELDLPLLATLATVRWGSVRAAADLACGTGRTGVWLAQHGVRDIDGVDITREMLRLAGAKNIYRTLRLADIATTNLSSASYDVCTLVLADEHLRDLEPVYREAARLIDSKGSFILVGYHPFFLMSGTPTHYHRESGEAVTIECYVHLFSEHYAAARNAGLILSEFQEHLIDQDWLRRRPKWRAFMHWPVSFALVWRHT